MLIRLLDITRGAVIALLVGLTARPAPAAFALTGVSGDAVSVSNNTVGWTFTVASGPGLPGITVTRLGWLDPTPEDDLAENVRVGLWTIGGVLLGEVTVQAGDPLSPEEPVDPMDAPERFRFRYAELPTPVVLAGGAEYVIGGLGGELNDYINSDAIFTAAPQITFGKRAILGSGGFGFPSSISGTGGRIGPNFEFTVNTPQAVEAVPAPPTAVLALIGLAGAGLARRRPTAGTPARSAVTGA